MTAWVASTSGFQPAIVPSSVENSSVAGPAESPDEMTKPPVALAPTPVGAPAPVPSGVGTETTSGEPVVIGCPDPSYAVATPAWLSATQSPLFSPTAMPQGLTRFGSVR